MRKNGVPDVARWTKDGWFDGEKRDSAPTAAVVLQARERVLAEMNEVVRWHRVRDFQVQRVHLGPCD